ncbi:MAG: hypothetical protein ACFFD4_00020 [Candidatus Odinarchaeota archaeon]
MSFLTKIIGRLSRGRADDLLLKGHDAFSVKDYKSAYNYFMRASKSFYDNRKMIITSLTNAGIAAENLGGWDEASRIYFQVSKLKAEEKYSIPEIKESLDKTRYIMKRTNSSNYSQVLAIVFLFALANQDIPDARKVLKEAQKLEEDKSDSYLKYISKVWNIFNAANTYNEQVTLPSIKFPREFQFIIIIAEEICQANSSLSVQLKLAEGTPERIKVGDPLRVQGIIEPFAPIKIKGYQLMPGSKGTMIKDPETGFSDLELSKSEMEFILEPQLTGKWIIGPLAVDYRLGKFAFKQQSNVLEIEVEHAVAELEITNNVKVIDEDFEYELVTSITNRGKGQLENINIDIKVPMGVKIASGTPKKVIAFLYPSESFEFTTRLEFDISAFTTGHEIRFSADYAGKRQETSIIIGGTDNQQ